MMFSTGSDFSDVGSDIAKELLTSLLQRTYLSQPCLLGTLMRWRWVDLHLRPFSQPALWAWSAPATALPLAVRSHAGHTPT